MRETLSFRPRFQRWLHKPCEPSVYRIPELNGLRVLLVFIVSWYHFWQQSWLTPHIGDTSLDFLVRAGYVPVDGTILLSGFLLFLPHARAMLLGERVPDLRTFYQKRVMRIVPSYYFVTLVMLFAAAIPYGLYWSDAAMWEDVIRHLTFTQTFDYASYINTPIGVASWTIAIEMQAYLLFPLLARCARKNPLATFFAMAAVALGFRGWCLWQLTDMNMVVNQLPNFLDVYAIGMGAALLYVKLTTLWPEDRRMQLALSALATALIVLAMWGLVVTLRAQAGTPGSALQAGQMMRRPVFALLLAVVAVSLPFALRPVRFLFGNRLMGFLAMVSMNYYLFHQNIAVYLKYRVQFPPAQNYPTPNMAPGGPEQPWANQYMALCFGLSLLTAIVVTFLVEKPGAWLLGKAFGKRRAAGNKRSAGDEHSGGNGGGSVACVPAERKPEKMEPSVRAEDFQSDPLDGNAAGRDTAANLPTPEECFRTGPAEGGCEIRECNAGDSRIVIPAEIGGVPVVRIGSSAFESCKKMTSVVIPGSVKEIADHAFCYCGRLSSVTISQGVREISGYAFEGCYRLENVVIPESVRVIGECAFRQCDVLDQIQIAPDHPVYTIRDGALVSRDGTLICVLDAGGKTVCTVPEGVTRIGSCVFFTCRQLTRVIIPDSVTEIGEHAFSGCKRLTDVVIPPGVTKIAKGTFMDCEALGGILIPEGVTKIGKLAFSGCTALTDIRVSPENPAYMVRGGVLMHRDGTLIFDPAAYRTENYTVPEGVTRICEHAFFDCKTMTSLTIPEGVTEIGDSAFSYCESLRRVSIRARLTKISDAMFRCCHALTDVVIPDTVTEICYAAFWLCDHLESIVIPESVKTIGDNAFLGCKMLTRVTLPPGVKIGDRVFIDCPYQP